MAAILKKVDGLTEAELQERVESHFINYAELKADDFNGYFIDRAKSLLNLIEKAMNNPSLTETQKTRWISSGQVWRKRE